MHILFGSEHDGLHIDPHEPGEYEWWYFDAISDDGRYAIVVIYLLGTPMSPYYHRTQAGENLQPLDWCGVFVTLHERVSPGGTDSMWRERAYSYNLYRQGTFAAAPTSVSVGGSTLRGIAEPDGKFEWNLDVNEPGLWLRRTRANLRFTSDFAPPPPRPSPGNTDTEHTWVCVAPVCRVEGTIRTDNNQGIEFRGSGYHDHNFGKLPYQNSIWYWGRARLLCSDALPRTAVFYHLLTPGTPDDSILLLFAEGETGEINSESLYLSDADRSPTRLWQNPYGLRHRTGLLLADDPQTTTFRIELAKRTGSFSESPFYRRVPIHLFAMRYDNSRVTWVGNGAGIGEIFVPSRLRGQIVSRAVWTRIRRR